MRVSLAAALCAVPSIGAAQVASVNPPLGVVSGAYSFDLSDGEPISWFLEFSEPLKLTPDQKTSLIAIRRRLRGENERFMERLDSTAQSVGLTLGERTARMRGNERQALERFNKVTQPTRDSIRVNNDIARAEALTLLTSVQTVRLDSLMAVLNRGRGVVRRGRGAGVGGS
ncbi:MAG: hypothetical protein ACREOG_06765 [Gemmatimonadaceae bacterium]